MPRHHDETGMLTERRRFAFVTVCQGHERILPEMVSFALVE